MAAVPAVGRVFLCGCGFCQISVPERAGQVCVKVPLKGRIIFWYNTDSIAGGTITGRAAALFFVGRVTAVRQNAAIPNKLEEQRKISGNMPEWMCRLKGLPEEQQSHIAKKYYGGKMPWREDKRGSSVQR